MARVKASRSTPSRGTPLGAGLGLAAAALLLDAGVLLRWLGPLGARESPALELAASLARIGLFAAGVAVLTRRRRAADPGVPFPLRGLLAGAGAWLGFVAAARLFAAARGVPAILLAATAVASLLLALRQATSLLAVALGRRPLPRFRRLLLALAAAAVAAALLEALLGALASRPPRASPSPAAPRAVMPEALARREVTVPGAHAAWWWQGQLHVFDAEGFRRTEPFPPRRPGVLRVVAVGDSLTYGYGVAAEEAWPAVLERELGRARPVEVLNLGVCGAQSEEIGGVVERHLAALAPDLVVYGVCLNDFLPAGRAEYANNRAWPVSFPGSAHLEAATRLGALAAAGYDRLLMRLGVRADFTTDILRGFGGYRERFARDVALLNRAVTARGLPPVVALVLDQRPDTRGAGWRIAQAAEEALRAAGMTVVPAEGYVRANDGRLDLVVSRWEGHPGAEAHRIFAAELTRAIAALPPR